MQNAAGRRPPKRLLFDRRYGWVVDEWRDPSEEALAGGRGMFCILPIATSLVNVASQSIDFVASSVIKALEKRDQIFPPKWNPEYTHQASKADYMNEHLRKVTLFDPTIKQNELVLQGENSSEAWTII